MRWVALYAAVLSTVLMAVRIAKLEEPTMRGQTHDEEHREFMLLMLLLTFAAVALIVGCDNGTVPTPVPTPVVVASPTPRPTATPVGAPSCAWPDTNPEKAKCVPDSTPGFFVAEMEDALWALRDQQTGWFRKPEIEELWPQHIGDAGRWLEDYITLRSRGIVCAAYAVGTPDDEIQLKGDNARSETIDWLMADLRLRHRGHVITCSPSAF